MAFESQINFSTYYDSNPRENINDIESTVGLKGRGLIKFDTSTSRSRIHGSFLGQGYLEPALLFDSKVIVNAEVGGQYGLLPHWQLGANLKSFQKVYFEDFQRSGRTTFRGVVNRVKPQSINYEIGVLKSLLQIDNGTLFQYTDQKIFFSLNRPLSNKLRGELRWQGSLIQYEDYPARIIQYDTLYSNVTEDQEDRSWLLGGQLKYTGRMILGLSISYEDIRSNSEIDEATILAGKLYGSGRISPKMFIHVVLQGMNKYYGRPDFSELNPHRDPEENIQNQLHVQIDRVLDPQKMIYLQYSAIKNETVFNHWFYYKNLFELGIKVTI